MIVVDSSIALRWLIPEEGTVAAEALVGQDLAAPDIIFVEVANVLGKKVRGRELPVEQAIAGLDLVARNIARIEPARPLIPSALRLSAELSHPVYDCLFLACAIALHGQVATQDGRFSSRAIQRGFGAHFVGGQQ